MPWQKVKPMDQRVLFISDYLRNREVSFVELCRRYGVSRKTGYKWVERYKTAGVDGLNEQSRRPRAHPDAIPYAVRKAVIELRQKGRIKLGPKKIQVKLKDHYPESQIPSITSIHNILKKACLIDSRPKCGGVFNTGHLRNPLRPL